MLTTDNIAYDTDDIPSPAENNNKVVVTNDYGLVDYSFIEPYTTSVYDSDSNTSIVVTSGTSGRIDNSLLNTTNSSTNGANKVVITDDSGLINYNLIKASVTPLANYIPISNSSNKLDNNWLNNVVSSSGSSDRSKFVLTNANGKINNNLLNTTTTPTASSIPLSDSNGKINDAWLTTTTTSTPDTIVKLDGTGKLDASLIKTGLFIPMTGGEPSGNIIIQGSGSQVNRTLADLKAKYPNFYGFGSNSYSDGFLIGMNGSSDTDNYLVIATHDNGKEPIIFRQYKGTTGYNNMEDNVNHEVTLMDKDGYTSVLKLTSANDIISTNGGLSVKSNITSTNGNLSIAGTSTLTGNVTAKGTLSVTGAITNSSTITSSGLITANNGVKTTTLNASSNASISGTLSVTGASTLTGNVSAKGTLTTTGMLTANGGVIISGAGDKINASGDTSALLRIGSINGNHLALDEDEISSRSNSTTGKRGLYLQPDGGDVILGEHAASSLSIKNGGTLTSSGKITANNGVTVNNDFLIVNKRMLVKALKPSEFSDSVHNNAEPLMYISPKTDGTVSNGNVTLLGGRGNTIIAGGESGMELFDYTYNTNASGSNSDGHYGTNSTAFNNDGDHLYLIADSNVYVQTGIQTNAANLKTFTFSNGGDFSVPRNASVTGSISSGSLSTGPISCSTITATGNITATGKTVTAGNFAGKWAGYTQDIGTKPNIADATWILLNNSANIQHTTIGDIKSLIGSGVDASSLGNSGYIKFKNGLVFEWGRSDFNGSLTKSVNVACPLASIYVAGGWDYAGTANNRDTVVHTISWSPAESSSTNLLFYTNNTTTSLFTWFVIGKA